MRLPDQSLPDMIYNGEDFVLSRLPQGLYLLFRDEFVRPDYVNLVRRHVGEAFDSPLQFLHPIPFRLREEWACKVDFHIYSPIFDFSPAILTVG